MGGWTMSRAQESLPTLKVTGGRARSDVSYVTVTTGSYSEDIVPDRHGWFFVVLEGDEPATITVCDRSGGLVADVDGIAMTLRIE
jgi:hypothetical protein